MLTNYGATVLAGGPRKHGGGAPSLPRQRDLFSVGAPWRLAGVSAQTREYTVYDAEFADATLHESSVPRALQHP